MTASKSKYQQVFLFVLFCQQCMNVVLKVYCVMARVSDGLLLHIPSDRYGVKLSFIQSHISDQLKNVIPIFTPLLALLYSPNS